MSETQAPHGRWVSPGEDQRKGAHLRLRPTAVLVEGSSGDGDLRVHKAELCVQRALRRAPRGAVVRGMFLLLAEDAAPLHGLPAGAGSDRCPHRTSGHERESGQHAFSQASRAGLSEGPAVGCSRQTSLSVQGLTGAAEDSGLVPGSRAPSVLTLPRASSGAVPPSPHRACFRVAPEDHCRRPHLTRGAWPSQCPCPGLTPHRALQSCPLQHLPSPAEGCPVGPSPRDSALHRT